MDFLVADKIMSSSIITHLNCEMISITMINHNKQISIVSAIGWLADLLKLHLMNKKHTTIGG